MDYREYIYDKFIFKVKNGIYYHKDGCWVEVDGGIATIGVSDFFQTLNGEPGVCGFTADKEKRDPSHHLQYP
jgi:glycine cleavage system H lipoate-binding protein